jgi:hypothetical protein
MGPLTGLDTVNSGCLLSFTGAVCFTGRAKFFNLYNESVDADDGVASRVVAEAGEHLLVVHAVGATGSAAFLWSVATRRQHECQLPFAVQTVVVLRCGVLLQAAPATPGASSQWYTWLHLLEEPVLVEGTSGTTLLAALDDGGQSAVLLARDERAGLIVPFIVTGSRVHGSLEGLHADGGGRAHDADALQSPSASLHDAAMPGSALLAATAASGSSAATRRTVRFEGGRQDLPDPASAASRRTRLPLPSSASSRMDNGDDMDVIAEDEGEEDVRRAEEEEDGFGMASGTRVGPAVRRFDPASANAFLQEATFLAYVREEAGASVGRGTRRWTRGKGTQGPTAGGDWAQPLPGGDALLAGLSHRSGNSDSGRLGQLSVGPEATALDDSFSSPDSEAVSRFAALRRPLGGTVPPPFFSGLQLGRVDAEGWDMAHSSPGQPDRSAVRASHVVAEWFPVDALAAAKDSLSPSFVGARVLSSSARGSGSPLGGAFYHERTPGGTGRSGASSAPLSCDMLVMPLPPIALPAECTGCRDLRVLAVHVGGPGRLFRVFVSFPGRVFVFDYSVAAAVEDVQRRGGHDAMAGTGIAGAFLGGATSVDALSLPSWLALPEPVALSTNAVVCFHDGSAQWQAGGRLVYAWSAEEAARAGSGSEASTLAIRGRGSVPSPFGAPVGPVARRLARTALASSVVRPAGRVLAAVESVRSALHALAVSRRPGSSLISVAITGAASSVRVRLLTPLQAITLGLESGASRLTAADGGVEVVVVLPPTGMKAAVHEELLQDTCVLLLLHLSRQCSRGSPAVPSVPTASLDAEAAAALCECFPPEFAADVFASVPGAAAGAAPTTVQVAAELIAAARLRGEERHVVSAVVLALLSDAIARRALSPHATAWPHDLRRITDAAVRAVTRHARVPSTLHPALLAAAARADILVSLGHLTSRDPARLNFALQGAVLERMPWGAGLCMLTTHGMVGKPLTEAGQAGAAAAVVLNAVLGIGDMAGGMPFSQDADGLDSLAAGTTVAGLRFPWDSRLRTVGNMLRGSRPHKLAVDRAAGASDHDYVACQQQVLFWHARRIAAAAVGRGMATAATLLPSYVDPVPVPLVTVAAFMQPSNVLLRLDVSGVATTGVGIMDWPEFGNGCAAALRILPHFASAESSIDGTPSSSSGMQRRLQRAWLRSHRFNGVPPDLAAITAIGAATAVGAAPANAAPGQGGSGASGLIPPNPAQAGVYMALGMTGALVGASASELYELLSLTHTCTTVGVLLGGAAGSRGSADPILVKSAILHIPAILPEASMDLDIPPVVQSCSLVALGLLHEGSAARSMTDFFLKELGRSPAIVSESMALDREAYSASAGYALGLVNLGLGSSAAHSDLKVSDRLLRFMLGGRNPAGAAAAKAALEANSSRPDLSYEGERINTSVTAPGAVLALSLMFLRTGNARVIAALAPPDTLALLDSIRPDVLLLRCTARSLVAWHEHDVDDAERTWDYAAMCADGEPQSRPGAPCDGPVLSRARWEHSRRARVRSWVTAQVPAAVRRVMRRIYVKACAEAGPGAAMAKLAQLMAMAREEEEAEAAAKAGSEAAGAAKSAAPAARPPLDPGDAVDGPLDELDLEQVKTAYAMCLSGACLGLGMRYAGTGDPIIRDELLAHTYTLILLRESSDKAIFARVLTEVNALAAAAQAAAFASARQLYGELTQRDGLAPNSAVDLVNSLLALPCETVPAPDDLITPWHEPLPGFPFAASADGASLQAAPLTTSSVPGGPPRTRTFTLPTASALAPGRAHVEHALVSALCGTAIAIAGSGDLAVLRAVRIVRRRLDKDTGYGSLMGSSMAAGMVALGAGRATLSRSNSSIASLLAAFFPYWPNGTASNSFWPQALRNLWACAVDIRCLDTLEVSPSVAAVGDGQAVPDRRMRPVRACVTVQLKPILAVGQVHGRMLRLTTPCVLPELHTIDTISVLEEPPADVRPGGEVHPTWSWLPYSLAVGGEGAHAQLLTACLQPRAKADGAEAEHAENAPATPGHVGAAPSPLGGKAAHEAAATGVFDPSQPWLNEFAVVSPGHEAARGRPDETMDVDADVTMASVDLSLEQQLFERAPEALREALSPARGRERGRFHATLSRTGRAEAAVESAVVPHARRCVRSIVLCVQGRST